MTWYEHINVLLFQAIALLGSFEPPSIEVFREFFDSPMRKSLPGEKQGENNAHPSTTCSDKDVSSGTGHDPPVVWQSPGTGNRHGSSRQVHCEPDDSLGQERAASWPLHHDNRVYQ